VPGERLNMVGLTECAHRSCSIVGLNGEQVRTLILGTPGTEELFGSFCPFAPANQAL
jgi:hypothetical protein